MKAEEIIEGVEQIGEILGSYSVISPLVQKVGTLLPQVLVDILKPGYESKELRTMFVESKKATLEAYIEAGFTREEAITFMLDDSERLKEVIKTTARNMKMTDVPSKPEKKKE